jgi:hypothetical protein
MLRAVDLSETQADSGSQFQNLTLVLLIKQYFMQSFQNDHALP